VFTPTPPSALEGALSALCCRGVVGVWWRVVAVAAASEGLLGVPW
jgi:hypothetical protein